MIDFKKYEHFVDAVTSDSSKDFVSLADRMGELDRQGANIERLLTAAVGLIFLHLVPLPLYLVVPLAVGFGVGLMILFNVTHPPAGGNPIIVIMGSVSIDYLLNPIIIGSIIILVFGVIINRFILKKAYPNSK